jgi:hypothetical protein
VLERASVTPFQILNQLAYFYENWYEHRAIGGPQHHIFHFLNLSKT